MSSHGADERVRRESHEHFGNTFRRSVLVPVVLISGLLGCGGVYWDVGTDGGQAVGGGSATGGGQGRGGGAETGGGSATGGGQGTGGGTATGGGRATGGGTATGGGSSAGGGKATGGGSAAGGGKATGGGTGTGGGGTATGGGAGGGAAAGTPVALHGKLSVKGNRIVDEAGKAVQLRGMSFGWSQWWGQYWTSGTVSWLVDDWKVQIVRAAMGIESEDGKGYLDVPNVERAKVTTVVDEAIRRGIYVIIDWHDHNAPNHVAQAKDFFTEMTQRYGQYPNVIYEIFNEPDDKGPGGNGEDSWDVIKTYANSVIPVIRAKDPDNLIIVGTPSWSQRVDQAANDPLSGTNIAYTLHFYAATHKQYLRDYATQALSKGVALFVTEWGVCEATGTGTLDASETDTWLKFMDDNMLSWANWDIADKNGETCSALLPNRSNTGGWSSNDLTAAGELLRGKLRSYAGASP